ncbi:ABC transporter permease [[Clostridium] colinum]|uniref:ABC transporter permease n=1 Tax=[Clostridium] colinum TaxID=36835 RepID=UPI002023CAB6|nr:ABC transporter permease [[Clostridium] colinum]
MNIIENFKSAIFNILSSKMRTFLTTLGIIIGITSVIIITAIGKGFKNNVNSTFSDIDTGTISVTTAYDETIRDKDKFVLKDLDRLKDIKNVDTVMPSYSTNVSVKLKDPSNLKSCFIYGVNEDAKNLKKIKMKYGRFIDEKDRQSKAKVCVIDNNLAREIFGREDAVGETISIETVVGKIKSTNLEIIGINSVENTGFYTPNIYYPVETAMEFLDNPSQTFEGIDLKLVNSNKFEQTKREIIKVLNANHNNEEKKYGVQGNLELVKSMSGTVQIFTLFIGLVAGISLLVGGIGVMNIMLVTVTERTREIGIRKSLGATNNNIKMQFLIEAITVALLGGVIGILFGYLGSFSIGKIATIVGAKLKPDVSIPVVLGAVITSSMIGIIFGVYPAGKAAKLDPIEALRYE